MIESHPDNALEDLRLDQPFAELKNHMQSYDLDSMDKKVHILSSAHLCIVLGMSQLCLLFLTGSLPLYGLFAV